MKNNNFLYGFLGIVAAVTVAAPLAFAETSGSADGKMEMAPMMMKVDADSKTEIEMSGQPVNTKGMPIVPVNLEVKGGVRGDVMMKPMEDGVEDEPMHMEGKGDDKGGMQMEMKGDDRGVEHAMMEADEHAQDALLNAELHVDVHTLMESEAKEDHSGEVEIESADEVHSTADFEHFIAHKAKDDERIKEVALKGGKVEMTYAMPVEFLGFWDTTLDTTMSADASGDVEFDYPWYAVFMKKNFSKKTVEPILKAEVEAKKKGDVSVEVKGTTTASTKVRTFAAPHILEAMVSAAAKVKASWNLKENVK